jgi:flagellar motility protein MotE (MotC chaperone)
MSTTPAAPRPRAAAGTGQAADAPRRGAAGAPPSAAARGAQPPASPPRRRIQPRLIPALIFVALVMLGFRASDLWTALESGAATRAAQAQAPGQPLPLPGAQQAPGAAAPAQTASAQGAPAAPASQALVPVQAAQAPERPAVQAAVPPGARDLPPPIPADRFGDAEQEVLQRLAERRAELNRRELALDQRQALLAAAEERIDRKVAELRGIRSEIQELVRQADQLDQQETERLVRMYENMRPADAARIMGDLSMPVLLEVVGRMRESKAAPILASMDPGRARDVTTRLAERRQIPPVPPE